MKNTLKRLTALALAVLMCSMLLLTGCSPSRSVSGTPKLTKAYVEEHKAEVLKNSMNFAEIFADGENPFASLFAAAPVASMDMGMDFTALTGMNMAMALSAAADEKNFKNNVGLSVTLPEMDPLDLNVYFDKKQLALSSAALLGEGASYGITFDKLDAMIEKFDNSALAATLGLPAGSAAAFCNEYGINEEYLKKVSDAYNSYVKSLENITVEAYDSVYAAYEPYYGAVSEETVELDGAKIDAVVLDVNASTQMVTDVFDVYLDIYRTIFEGQIGFYTAIIPEALRADMMPALDEQKNMMLAQLETLSAELTANLSFDGTIRYYLDKNTGLLVKAVGDLNMNIEDQPVHMVLNEYFDNGITFDAVVTDEAGEKINVTGSITCPGAAAVLNIDAAMGEETANVKVAFETDKAAGTYKCYASMTESGETTELFNIDGKLSYTANSFDMTIDTLTADGEELPLGMSFAYKTSAEIAAPAEMKDLLTLSEEEVYELVGRLSASFGELGSLFGAGMDETYDDQYDAEAYEPLSYDDYEEYAD